MHTSERNHFETDKRKTSDKMGSIDDYKLESTQSPASNSMNLYNPLKQFMHDKINERFIEGLKICHTMAKLVDSQQTNQLDIMLNVESIFTLSSKSNIAANTTAGNIEAVPPVTAFAHPYRNIPAEKKLESTDNYARSFRLKRKHKDLEISVDEDSRFTSPMSVGSMFSFGNVTKDGVGVHHKLSDINETGSSQECKKSIVGDTSRPRILGSSIKPNPGFQPTAATTNTSATSAEFNKSQKVYTGPINIQALKKKGPLSAEPIIYSQKGKTSSFSPAAAAAAAAHTPKFASTQVLSMPGKTFQTDSKKYATYSKDSVPKLNKPVTAPWNTSQGQTRPLSSTRSIHGTNERTGIISSRLGPISSAKLGGGTVSSSGVNASSSVASVGGAQRSKPIGKQTTPISTVRAKEGSVLNDAQRTTLKTNKNPTFYKTHTAKVPPTEQELALRHEPEDSFEFDSSYIASWANDELTGSNFLVPSSPVNVNCLLPVRTDNIFSKEDRCINRSKYS